MANPNGRLVSTIDGHEFKIGDEVTDFRGEKHILKGWRAPAHGGSTGRVHLQNEKFLQEFFPGVIKAVIVEAASDE